MLIRRSGRLGYASVEVVEETSCDEYINSGVADMDDRGNRAEGEYVTEDGEHTASSSSIIPAENDEEEVTPPNNQLAVV